MFPARFEAPYPWRPEGPELGEPPLGDNTLPQVTVSARLLASRLGVRTEKGVQSASRPQAKVPARIWHDER